MRKSETRRRRVSEWVSQTRRVSTCVCMRVRKKKELKGTETGEGERERENELGDFKFQHMSLGSLCQCPNYRALAVLRYMHCIMQGHGVSSPAYFSDAICSTRSSALELTGYMPLIHGSNKLCRTFCISSPCRQLELVPRGGKREGGGGIGRCVEIG
jgi:hypothetical protein